MTIGGRLQFGAAGATALVSPWRLKHPTPPAPLAPAENKTLTEELGAAEMAKGRSKST